MMTFNVFLFSLCSITFLIFVYSYMIVTHKRMQKRGKNLKSP
jgi:hypothetical protein